MKLRIKGNSLRVRVTRSELTKLIDTGQVEETIHFSSNEQSRLTYVLRHEPGLMGATVRYQWPEVVVLIPEEEAATWVESGQVGIYATVDLGSLGVLDLIVEKDFACLDLSDAENVDTFANPNASVVCP